MKKKLIEVALPLQAINKEAAREKSIRHGHPSTLHLWWARRPLAACRAVLFASLVDDPSSNPEMFPTEGDQDRERQRLFQLLEELVKWENSNNKRILDAAHLEIEKSTGGNPPPIYDPFCGGGSIPLEAQRLGLEPYASDLNPVATLITKALIQIPQQFAGQPPVHPMPPGRTTGKGMWPGARGLAEDVRYYGQWMRDKAFERVGHLYPNVRLPEESGSGEATTIAWIWARTVMCPNPACKAQMPLVRSFILATKAGKEVWIEPQVNHTANDVSFQIRIGNGKPPTGTVDRRGAKCIVCGATVPFEYIRAEGKIGRLGCRLMAVAAEGNRGRIYVAGNEEHERVAAAAIPSWIPDTQLPGQALGFRVQAYGMTSHKDLFTSRQLAVLGTFSQLVPAVRPLIVSHGGSEEYATAVSTYLAFAITRMSCQCSTICYWSSNPAHELVVNMFARQAIPMTWDFGEINPFCEAASWTKCLEFVARVLDRLAIEKAVPVHVKQLDASTLQLNEQTFCVVTDPPYYDQIGYADLSDFFYIWLRKALSDAYPDLFATLLTPKRQELIATPFRFAGDREKAKEFFEQGLSHTFTSLLKGLRDDCPLVLFYAFKQAESQTEDGEISVSSTGWETMLDSLLRAGFSITGTWPVRTERPTAVKATVNALASSIVLVCRRRPGNAAVTTRRDFISTLNRELPKAVRNLQKGNIAPVDLAQAAIGPGMAVFSRYNKVLETDGSLMRVRTALGLINQTLDEVLSEQEGEFDPDTRWALAWFEEHAFDEGLYGEAEVLATAKALSVSALDETKILHSRAGKVRLLRRDELAADWNPSSEHRLTVWAVTQHLIRSLDKNGETATATLASKVGGLAEAARDLAYRLYVLSERMGWAEEAGYYNSLVVSWPTIAPKTFALS